MSGVEALAFIPLALTAAVLLGDLTGVGANEIMHELEHHLPDTVDLPAIGGTFAGKLDDGFDPGTPAPGEIPPPGYYESKYGTAGPVSGATYNRPDPVLLRPPIPDYQQILFDEATKLGNLDDLTAELLQDYYNSKGTFKPDLRPPTTTTDGPEIIDLKPITKPPTKPPTGPPGGDPGSFPAPSKPPSRPFFPPSGPNPDLARLFGQEPGTEITNIINIDSSNELSQQQSQTTGATGGRKRRMPARRRQTGGLKRGLIETMKAREKKCKAELRILKRELASLKGRKRRRKATKGKKKRRNGKKKGGS